jgi:hypothetical protein
MEWAPRRKQYKRSAMRRVHGQAGRSVAGEMSLYRWECAISEVGGHRPPTKAQLTLAAPAAHAHDELYRGDFHSFRRLGQSVDPDITDEVDQLALAFDEEVMVIARVGVEIGGAGVDRHRAQKSGFGELMQGVINRRERHSEAGDIGLGVQIFRRNVAMPFGEEDAAQLDPLPGRPQPGLAERAAIVSRRAEFPGGGGSCIVSDTLSLSAQ